MKRTAQRDTYYIGKAYEEQVEDNTEKQICYITIGGKTIGTHVEIKDTDYVPTNSHYNVDHYNRYFHTDALGSITAITDDNGTVVERRSYDAFGKIRAMDYGTNNNTLSDQIHQTTRAFTGHEQIAELPGLIHMNARLYDSEIGRFLSADTIIQDPHDSQSYNRYSYVRNNPLVYTDPSGHSWWSKLWKKVKHAWKKVVGAVLTVVGVVVAALVPWGQTIGAAIAGAGVSLYNYDNTHRFEFHAPIIEIGGGGKSEEERIADLQDQYIATVRINAGVATTSNAPVNNDKYANGAATGSYSSMGDNFTLNSDGSYNLGTITVTGLSAETEARIYNALIADAANIASLYYEAFTYTNIGGVLDVGVQYYRGEISGWYAAGLLGATALGGKAGGKAYQYGFSNTERLYSHFEKHGGDIMKGLNRTDYNVRSYLYDANYVIHNGQYLPEMNGYVSFMGKDGRANYAFVGMTKDKKYITTFGIRSVNVLRGL